MDSFTLPESRAGRFALAVGFWTLVGLFFSTEVYVAARPESADWGVMLQSMKEMMPRWYLWGAFTVPFIAVERMILGRRPPFGRRVRFHLVAGFLWALAFYVALETVESAIGLGTPSFTLFSIALEIHWNFAFYCMIVGVCVAYDYHQESRERALREAQLESRLTQARLAALQAQLNPHFLFNTLNTISAFAETQPHTARRLIGNLGNLLRTSLELGEKQEIELADELQFVQDYLSVQLERFGDQFAIAKAIDPDTLHALVPSLVLQPLVENSVKHGANGTRRKNTITIAAARRNGMLELTVSDQGPGLPEGWDMRSSGGIGLCNTAERLAELYGRDSSLVVRNDSGGGVVAEVVIPWKEAPASDD